MAVSKIYHFLEVGVAHSSRHDNSIVGLSAVVMHIDRMFYNGRLQLCDRGYISTCIHGPETSSTNLQCSFLSRK